MCRPNRTTREQFSVQCTEVVEQGWIGLRRTTKSESRSFPSFDCKESVHSVVPRIEQTLCYYLEGNSGRGKPDAAALSFSIEMEPRVFLELLGMGAEVWLRRVKHFRRCSEAVVLQYCE